MGGVLTAMIGAGSKTLSITAGSNGTTPPTVGFNPAIGLGSINPSGATINGATVTIIQDQGPGDFFSVQLNGVLPQNHFASMMINGAVRATASVSSFNTSGGVSSWQWNGARVGLAGGTTYPVSYT
jgi:hypothetical protein